MFFFFFIIITIVTVVIDFVSLIKHTNIKKKCSIFCICFFVYREKMEMLVLPDRSVSPDHPEDEAMMDPRDRKATKEVRYELSAT